MMKYGDITGRIIGCAMRVHSFLGSGFHEKIYQKALGIEMSIENLSYREEMTILFFIGKRELDAEELIFSLKTILSLN